MTQSEGRGDETYGSAARASQAVHIDHQTGIETRLEHVITPRGLLYTSTTRPNGARRCVIICSSVFGDFLANYHRERTLSRALSARGIGSIRFHYAGEGNSQGERKNMTFQTLCSDASAVLSYAKQSAFTSFALFGTRMGALVAAKTVSPMPSVPLALWQPVIDPLRFLRDAHRAKRISQVAHENSDQHSDWQAELSENGVLDLLGYDVYPKFIESIQGVTVSTLLGTNPRPVLVAHFKGQSRENEMLVGELVGGGFSVASRKFDLSEPWWFDRVSRPHVADLIPATAEWLQNHLMAESGD